MKLLIVEDDLLLQEGLALGLANEGYAPDCAGTAAEADALIQSGEYSLVILDLGLPDKDGATLLSQSLLDAYDSLPPGGVSAAGESAGYGWQAQSQPIATPANANPQAVRLHELRLTVHWVEGARERALELLTLRPERKPEPGGRLP